MLSKSKVKYIQSLGQKKQRQQEDVFVAEGPKLVTELLKAKEAEVISLFALKEWIDENSQMTGKTEIVEITGSELEKISQLNTPNQVLALVKKFETAQIPKLNDTITLALDDIRDPGNLGTIIRIADWFGIRQILCSPDCADMYNSKVVQATMGSIARVKIYYDHLPKVLSQYKLVPIYAAVLGGQDVKSIGKLEEGILLIGNESKGLNKELQQIADVQISIAKKGSAESLNAAVATGIILSHLV